MKRAYEMPKATLLNLSSEDIMSLSIGGTGSDGGGISFDDWFSRLGNGGQGNSGLEVDINDLFDELS